MCYRFARSLPRGAMKPLDAPTPSPTVTYRCAVPRARRYLQAGGAALGGVRHPRRPVAVPPSTEYAPSFRMPTGPVTFRFAAYADAARARRGRTNCAMRSEVRRTSPSANR